MQWNSIGQTLGSADIFYSLSIKRAFSPVLKKVSYIFFENQPLLGGPSIKRNFLFIFVTQHVTLNRLVNAACTSLERKQYAYLMKCSFLVILLINKHEDWKPMKKIVYNFLRC